MNQKNIKLLTAVFLGLLLIAIFPWVKGKFSPQEDSKEKKFENISLNFSDFSKENVEKISIKESDRDEIILSIKDGIWMVNEKEAAPEKIAALFQDLALAKVQKQSSKNKNNHQKFEVDQVNAITLTITSNKKEHSFFIGKNGPAYDSFYVRKKGVANVYLVGGELKMSLIKEASEWEKSEETESAENEVDPSKKLQLP